MMMRAIAYSIKPNEKESLTLTNEKKHSLTLISNDLNDRTLLYAQGKEAVIISSYDLLDRRMLLALKEHGVRYIITRSRETTHIDLEEATRLGFKIANVPSDNQSADLVSRAVIRNLDAWGQGKCVGSACCCMKITPLEEKKKIDRPCTDGYRLSG